MGEPPPGAFNIKGGLAENNGRFGVAYSFNYPGNFYLHDLNGTQSFEFTAPPIPADPGAPYSTEALVWGSVGAMAAYVHYDYINESGNLESRKTPSLARMDASDVQFTVHWQLVPVPEPSTWAMLLAGILPLLLLRRNGAKPCA